MFVDFSAHSNYVELALREMGVDAFPHVGENTEVEINGKKIWPLITGTCTFLHKYSLVYMSQVNSSS